MTHIVTTTLDCGMAVVVEPIADVASAAINWLLPVGAATDAADQDGHAAILSELIMRGAGPLTSRQHSDALDMLGVQRGTDVNTHHLRLDATLLGDRLDQALPLLLDMVCRPALPAEHLPAVKSLCLQSLEGLNDDPQTLAMLRLRERHHPPPFNRHGYGERAVIEAAAIDELRQSWQARCRPKQSILGIAGAVNPHRVAEQLNRLLGDWRGAAPEPRQLAPPENGYLHIEQPTAQVHIGLAYSAPPECDATSMVERIAVGVLSGSTSGRLFTEVRQKRSLCYSVGASYRAGRDQGMVTLYAGTTPERAQQTLDVCLEQIHHLKNGVTKAEFHRAVIGLKANMIMQGESTPARAGALVYDQFRLGRARTLDEMAALIDAVAIEQVNEHVAGRDFGEFTLVSIGAHPLEAPKHRKPETPKSTTNV